FFPPIVTKADARKVADQGFWAAIVVTMITVVFATVASILGPIEDVPINAWSFIDAGIFVALGLGIRKRSRVAAVAALALYWLNRIYFWSVVGFEPDEVSGLWMVVLLSVAFANGIRGTFAHHRLAKQPEVDG
ncbi:MAG: hypothetical protein WBB18_18725, partial [Nodosilinea sp.]